MKNVIIGGSIRSGKSTLCEKLHHELGYSVVESDTIVTAFDKVFPELNIKHNNPKLTKQNYAPFVNALLSGFHKGLTFHNIPTAFCGAQFLPQSLSEYKNINNFLVIFLGITDITAQELFFNIRQHDKATDWTSTAPDEKLQLYCNEIIKTSNFYKEECKKFNFAYFDTGLNREQAFNNVINYIKMHS